MTELFQTLADLPPILIYLIIGVGAAVENIVPPVPADTFVLLGAFLAAAGRASAVVVFMVTWVSNVASALAVYAIAHRYGERFFDTRIGKLMLNRRQLEQIGKFYDRWGAGAIFVSRFLPAFRAMVPVFAGVTGVGVVRVAIPLAAASAAWYGALVYVGAFAGANLDTIAAWFDRASTILLAVAGVLILLFAVWWWKTRKA
jgi:membrane protein DedA with SNARE-associated domain